MPKNSYQYGTSPRKYEPDYITIRKKDTTIEPKKVNNKKITKTKKIKNNSFVWKKFAPLIFIDKTRSAKKNWEIDNKEILYKLFFIKSFSNNFNKNICILS